MKKIWLTVAGSLFIALTAVNAQQRSDTTRVQTTTTTETSTNYRKSDTNTQESGTQGETSTIQGQSGTQGQTGMEYSWRDEDKLMVTREALPAGLVQTLKSDDYEGWENATIYRNKSSNDYMLVLQDNGSVRTFYFDQEGQARTQPGSASGVSGEHRTQDGVQHGTTGTLESSDSQGKTETSTSGSTSTQSGTTSTQSSTSGTPETTVTTGTTSPTGTTTTTETETETTIQTQQPSQAWRAEDRVIILADDVPASLRLTLDDDKYKGWENSTLYRNRNTNEYMIEIRDGSNAKVYYFDKDGKILDRSDDND